MRKTIALWSLTLLFSLSASTAVAGAAHSLRKPRWLAPVRAWNAPPQAAQAKQPQWKSTEEYNAFNAMATEADPNKRIPLAEAFLQKFANSDFKDSAYVVLMQSYQQLNQSDKAVEAGRKALEINPDNLQALGYLSFAFPFVFKADDPDATAKLSRAESDAKHGLELLQKLQKPANATEEQFNQVVKQSRGIFNNAIGFVALQRKDYASAVTSFKAAAEDSPSDVYTFYRLGLAYLYSSPSDYDHAVWAIARAVSLANAAKNPAGAEIDKFLKRAYVNYHGNDQGLPDIIAQAATSPNPPEGFKVAPMETPKPTGNPNIDAFNQMTFPLKLGGEKAQKQWDALKGQTLGLGGAIDTVEKGTEPGSYLVRIDVLEQSKAADGVYDVELKDSSQPNVKNLQKGDLVRFKGTADAYTATPNLVLTLVGEITTDLPDKPPAKEKPKPKPKAAPARRPARKTPG
jgi:tetratricopeptide (TPR) repeat protein